MSHNQIPGINMVYPEPCQESRRRPQLFMVCPFLTLVYPSFDVAHKSPSIYRTPPQPELWNSEMGRIHPTFLFDMADASVFGGPKIPQLKALGSQPSTKKSTARCWGNHLSLSWCSLSFKNHEKRATEPQEATRRTPALPLLQPSTPPHPTLVPVRGCGLRMARLTCHTPRGRIQILRMVGSKTRYRHHLETMGEPTSLLAFHVWGESESLQEFLRCDHGFRLSVGDPD